MRLVRFRSDGSEPRPGAVHDGNVVDLTRTPFIEEETDDPFRDVLETITRDGEEAFEDVVVAASKSASEERQTVDVVAPIASQGRLIALGGVFTQHLRERDQSLSAVPSQWLVPTTAIVGPGEQIVLPDRVSESVMPAVELGVVIGQSGRYIDEENAMDHVAGYTVVNDVTARTDWPGPMAYKLMDTFSPCGPHITLASDVGWATDLEMTLHQAGETVCRGSTASMRFTVPFLVNFLSSIMELRPGDVIATGDPGEVREELTVGETISATIEDVGELRNPVVSE